MNKTLKNVLGHSLGISAGIGLVAGTMSVLGRVEDQSKKILALAALSPILVLGSAVCGAGIGDALNVIDDVMSGNTAEE